MRGVAVLLVVAYHVGLPGFSGGFIGVDVFFAVSGYLITRLLYDELASHGRLELTRFYARRVRRLLPASSLLVATTMVGGLLLYSPLEQVGLARSAAATSVYVSNFFFMRSIGDYFQAEAGGNPLLHTWSLAVEEQFYLFWPVLLLVAWRLRASRGMMIAVMAAVTVVSFGLCVALTQWKPTWAFYASPARAWEFALGGIAALCAEDLRRIRRGMPLLGLVGLLAILISAVVYSGRTEFPGFAAAVPIGGTLAVLIAGEQPTQSTFSRFIQTPVLQWLGKLSYSWYLWHWPALVFLAVLVPFPSLSMRIAAGLASLAAAWAALRFIENPIRFHPALLHRSMRSLAIGAVLTFVGLGLSLLMGAFATNWLRQPTQAAILASSRDRTQLEQERCVVMFADARPRTCVYGDTIAETTIVLFGDSHAMQWFPALASMAEDRGWRLISLIKAGCPAADVVVRRATHKPFPQCTRWREAALAEIDRIRPDAVLISDYRGYVSNSRMQDWTDPVAEWRAGHSRLFATLAATGAVVVTIRDTPTPHLNGPVCLSRRAYGSFGAPATCDFPASDSLATAVFEAQKEAGAAFRNVRVVDLSSAFCDGSRCPVIQRGTIVYRDANHITSAFALRLTATLSDVLVPLI